MKTRITAAPENVNPNFSFFSGGQRLPRGTMHGRYSQPSIDAARKWMGKALPGLG